MSERLLNIDNLSVTFGGLQALNDLDFHVDEGEIVSVIGPNGAGKTTFFNAITGMVQPSSGDIIFEGESIVGLDPNQVTALGIARTFQNVRLFANMTVLENVMVAQHCRTKQGIFGALLPDPGVPQEEEGDPRTRRGRSSASSARGSSATGSISRRSCSPTPTAAGSRSLGPWPRSLADAARRADGRHEPQGNRGADRSHRASSAASGASRS